MLPLAATALTNLILYGLSDTLAQSLRNAVEFRQRNNELEEQNTPQSVLFQYVLEHGRPRQIWLDEEDDNLAELGLQEQSIEDTFRGDPIYPWDKFNFRRLGLFSMYGFLVSFIQSPWYSILRGAFSNQGTLVTVLQRVMADQLFYSPIMLCVFLIYLAVVIERQHWSVIAQNEFWKKYVDILVVNMSVWPLAQFINFLIIPTPAQIPFSGCLSVLWNTYLSLNTK